MLVGQGLAVVAILAGHCSYEANISDEERVDVWIQHCNDYCGCRGIFRDSYPVPPGSALWMAGHHQ